MMKCSVYYTIYIYHKLEHLSSYRFTLYDKNGLLDHCLQYPLTIKRITDPYTINAYDKIMGILFHEMSLAFYYTDSCYMQAAHFIFRFLS